MELDKLDRESVSVGEIGVAAFYASVLPVVTEVARKYGWAVAVHGSMNKDLDLMMMPWVEGAVSADSSNVPSARLLGGVSITGCKSSNSLINAL